MWHLSSSRVEEWWRCIPSRYRSTLTWQHSITSQKTHIHSFINKHSKKPLLKTEKVQDEVQIEALSSINVCRIQLERDLLYHNVFHSCDCQYCRHCIRKGVLHEMQLTGQDWMSVVELRITVQPCVFMLAPERGREGMIWLSFGWHRIFIEEALCECERERKQACMTACCFSHCCSPSHSSYWQPELDCKFISRKKGNCKSCMSLSSTSNCTA